MDRVVAQLLAEIDGAQVSGEGSSAALASHDLFIIGATNRCFLFAPEMSFCHQKRAGASWDWWRSRVWRELRHFLIIPRRIHCWCHEQVLNLPG